MSKTWTFSSIFKHSKRPLTDLSGHDVGRYHIVEKLGMGGMAAVYRAFDRQLQRDVAVKIIRIDAFAPHVVLRTRKRFEREAQSLAQMDHPNIIPIYDYGEYDKAPYLVMKFIRGGTLKDYITNSRSCAYNDAARLLAPVAHALGYAHSLDIIHRDVKPANILLSEAGVPLLSDFGVAKILEAGEGHTLTMDNAAVGTPEYMAPEQWENDISPQTDIYALGVVFYELVTGHKPYTADTPAAVHRMVLIDPLVRPRQWVADLPDEVEAVIYKAMARRKENRYASMDEFAAALGKLAVGAGNPRQTRAAVPDSPPVLRAPEMPIMDRELHVHEQSTRPLKNLKHPGPTGFNDWIKKLGIFRMIVILTALLAAGIWLVWKMLAPTPIPSLAVIPAVTVTNTFSSLTLSEPTKISPSNTSVPPTRSPSSTPEPTKEPEAGSTRVWEKDGMRGMYVPSGNFYMGTEDGDVDERPIHEVFLDGFWIDRTEISVAMYKKCQDEGDCEKIAKGFIAYTGDYENNPVNYADWGQARQYCEWAGRRLPSEAEWEKAARGTDMRTYPWGEGTDCGKANFLGCNQFSFGPALVDDFPGGASPYGALQMAGNLAEWVADYYDPDFYQTSPQINPINNETGYTRVVRGGSHLVLCNYPKKDCSADYRDLRVTTRHSVWPDNIGGNLGFRCAAGVK